jgi:hypothetical protein
MKTYKVELDNGRTLEVAYREINHDKMIIFLPGASGNSTSDRFNYIDKIGLETGHSILKMDYQFQQYKDESLTLKDCIKDVITVLEYIQRRDINAVKELVVIAKSFGCLIYHLSNVDATKAILLAPYMHVGTEDQNNEYINKRLDQLTNEEKYIGKESLKQAPHLIFHGKRDKTISITNSEKIAGFNSNYSVIEVDSDHGFEEEETHKKIIRESKKFLIGE